MYLRETKRRNRDGSTVSYLQLAHSERHPVTGVPSAKVIHNFGRADTVERVLFALVAQRALEPGSKLAATRWVAERVAIAAGLPAIGCAAIDRSYGS